MMAGSGLVENKCERERESEDRAKAKAKAKSRSAPPTRAPSSSSLSPNSLSSPSPTNPPISTTLSGDGDTNTGRRFITKPPKPRRRSSRTRHSSWDFKASNLCLSSSQKLLQLQGHPAFVISPLVPPELSPTFFTSTATPFSATTTTTANTSMMDDERGRYGYGYDDDGVVPENERPRRAVSSPQLVHTRTRARSDSASSSASLTATEENYARLRASGAPGAGVSGGGNGNVRGRGHGHSGHGYGVPYAHAYAHLPTSASASRFPTTYPPLWTFAAAAGGRPISPTSPDSSEAATSPGEDSYGDEEEEEEDSDEGGEGDDLIFVSRASSSTSVGSSHLRNRRNGVNVNGKRRGSTGDVQLSGGGAGGSQRFVTTARGQPCAGETETELDEMPIRLPTSRNVKSRPVVPLLVDFLVPFLFQITRFLSIVPAMFGMLYNMYLVFRPPVATTNGVKISSVDYLVCVLWAILTGFQCLFLTTGLLHRWKAYYTTVSTLIRLLALQGICWPATHFTLVLFDHTKRPLACWALIGTTTCFSRSVQLWVTSNLFMPPSPEASSNSHSNLNLNLNLASGGGKVLRSEGRLGPRRWDWGEVVVKCVLPAGFLYFVTAWAMVLKQDPLFATGAVTVR